MVVAQVAPPTPPATSTLSGVYVPQDSNKRILQEMYASLDCTGTVIDSSVLEPGVCTSRSQVYRSHFSISGPFVQGARLKRHCLCGDRRFKWWVNIPNWGTRTCSELSTELAWACSDAAVSVAATAAARDHMIDHCCDQTQTNDHYEWAACSVQGASEVNRQPDNYCTTSLEATGQFSNCAYSQRNSDCVPLSTVTPASSLKYTVLQAPPPSAPPGGWIQPPPPTPSPGIPVGDLISTTAELRAAIASAVRGTEKVIYLGAGPFDLGGTPLYIPGGKVRRVHTPFTTPTRPRAPARAQTRPGRAYFHMKFRSAHSA